jgi:hypothetical protein
MKCEISVAEAIVKSRLSDLSSMKVYWDEILERKNNSVTVNNELHNLVKMIGFSGILRIISEYVGMCEKKMVEG